MDTDLKKRIGALSDAKRKLLERKLAEKNNSHLSYSSVGELDDNPDSTLDFSFFFFSRNADLVSGLQYDLLIQCAKYADKNGFKAVWTPERHYKNFGGGYPNPSVLGAAVAMVTERVALRAGSVLLPLHQPQRVAEEWSVVDNLSNGRVGIAVASGWNPDDFANNPEIFHRRKELLYENIDKVQSLWKGGDFTHASGELKGKPLRIFPTPVQKQLPMWLTSLSDQSFQDAGRKGLNILTGMMEHDVQELARKIRLYRQALSDSGYDPQQGQVAVMLHTYIGDDLDKVKSLVRQPMISYLESFASAGESTLQIDSRFDSAYRHQKESDRREIMAFSFERYFSSRSLLGTIDSARIMALKLKSIGVNEIACLLDFGLDDGHVIGGLKNLKMLMDTVTSSKIKKNVR